MYTNNGNISVDGSIAPYGDSYSSANRIRVELDVDTEQIEFFRDNIGQGTIAINSEEVWFPVVARGTAPQFTMIFDPADFADAPTPGFLPLNSSTLSTPLGQGADNFAVLTWSGNNTNPRSITGAGFQPDWALYRPRNAISEWHLADVQRGFNDDNTTPIIAPSINATDATAITQGQILGVTSDGFTVDRGGSGDDNVNDGANDYVAWLLRAAGGGVINAIGSISASASAAPDGFFSIITWVGNAIAGTTIGHGLPGAPEMIIWKNRDTGRNTTTYHKAAGSGNSDYLMLDIANFKGEAGDDNFMNATDPSNTLITLGSSANCNESGSNMLANAFRSVPGICSVTSYTGNGAVDGPKIWFGFKSKLVLIKRVDADGGWVMYDTSRSPFNLVSNVLFADDPSVENTTATVYEIDILSDGIKIRDTVSNINANGGLYAVLAIAEIAGGGVLPPVPGA